MILTPLSITNAQYSKADNSAIDCVVIFEELKDRFPNGVPFTASISDVETHGQTVYQKIIAGEAGAIAAYVPPTTEQLAALVREKRNDLLIELDSLVDNPLRYATYSDAYKQALSVYRQALCDIPSQSGFPNSVTYPTLPNLS